MAFGLGFNKTKVLSNAEKYVQQGKLQNAIAEYEKVLKNDPRDLTVLNTVGDLYARLGEIEQACHCFKTVGDAYAQQGFTVKAIAMYKKLTKLKASLEGALKLAELYTQQGLFNDARQQYLQVAEEFLRSGELEQAVRIFQKTLEMDPENVAMKVRLAEVYVRLGKKNEAWQIFSSAADQLRARGQVGPAEDILQRMLALDPNNNQALLMRGRNALDAGDSASAIRYLQKVPDLDSQPEALKSLFQAYLAADRLSDAGALAHKLLTVHNDLQGISQFVDALMKAGLYQDALNIYQEHAERLMSADQAKVLDNLHTIIGHVRGEPESLELLLELFQKAGETTHICEVTDLLAHASVQKGDLEKARDLYQQLASIEPQNPIHAQNYQQVSAKLGGEPRSEMITAEEGAVIVDELEATAPSIEQDYPEEIAAAVRAALTDAELFVSYNMPAKALGPLLAVLPQAAQDVRLNQRLAALHTRAGRFAEAAVCCRILEKNYSDRGYADEAGRYGELASRYEQRSGTSPVTHLAAESSAAAAWPGASPQEVAEAGLADPAHIEELEVVTPSAAEEEPASLAGEQVDISNEWEDTLSEKNTAASEEPVASTLPEPVTALPEEPAPVAETLMPKQEEAPVIQEPPPPAELADDLVPETVEEIRFYLQHSMRLQALAAMAKLEAMSKDAELISAMHAEYEAAFAPVPVSDPEQPLPDTEFASEETAAQHAREHDEAMAEDRAAAGPTHGELEHIVADLESSLGDGFEPSRAPSAKPTSAPHRAVPAVAARNSAPTLGEFVADLESALGADFLPGAAQPPAPAPRVAAQVATPVAAGRPAAAPMAAAAAPARATRPSAEQAVSSGLVAAHPSVDGITDLSAMFSELTGELEEDTVTTAAEEDPETHYNLGVAFREMGLLDEAIGELQKVCHLVDRGNSFPQVMQTYTWLAQCFVDKGVPEAAIRWYERALKIPSIDEDTRTALHYELAAAHENARNKDAALSHFMEVYGSNIDYRDVAERIKALKS
jgi:pilus assembly protein FimV